MDTRNRYFGTADQQALELKADLLWQVVGGDPRYCCHGRVVALMERSAEAVDLQIALARLQGIGPSPYLTPEVVRARTAEIEAAGLVTDSYSSWTAEPSAVGRARDLLARRALPAGLSVRVVDAETPEADYDGLDALTQSCGVLLPAATFLRGEARPAVCLYARTPEGEVVGAAMSVAQNPSGSPYEGRVWWGMLSTAETWRGKGVAKLLGAMALIAMAERWRVTHFDTGIREGNAESAGLCAALGFAPSGLVDLMAIDPVAMSGGRLTK